MPLLTIDIPASDVLYNATFNWMKGRLDVVKQAKYDYFNSEEVFEKIGLVNKMLNILSLEAHSDLFNLSDQIEEESSGSGDEGSGSGDMHFDNFFDYKDYWNYAFYASTISPRAEIKNLKKLIRKNQKSIDSKNSRSSTFSTTTTFPNSFTTTQWEEIKELMEDFSPEHENITISDLLGSHGWKINIGTVPYIGYRKQDLKRSILEIEPTIHGNCMTFDTELINEKIDLKQKTAGSSNGLKLILNIQQDYYTDAIRENENHNDLPFTNSIAGLRVFIHDHDEVLPLYESGIDVGPGKHASIGLIKQEYNSMYKPWGNCDKETIKENSNDTMNTCLQTCYARKVIKNCECKPHYLTNFIINQLAKGATLNENFKTASQYKTWLKVPECNINHLMNQNCSSQVLRIKNLINPVYCNCKTPCRSTVYDFHVSYSDFPNNHLTGKENFTHNYEKILPSIREALDGVKFEKSNFERHVKQHLSENLVYLDIYFDDMKVTKVKENIADNLSSLVSDIGGQFGLWLGISILTVVEIFYCCFVIIPRYWLRRLGVVKKKEEVEKAGGDAEFQI